MKQITIISILISSDFTGRVDIKHRMCHSLAAAITNQHKRFAAAYRFGRKRQPNRAAAYMQKPKPALSSTARYRKRKTNELFCAYMFPPVPDSRTALSSGGQKHSPLRPLAGASQKPSTCQSKSCVNSSHKIQAPYPSPYSSDTAPVQDLLRFLPYYIPRFTKSIVFLERYYHILLNFIKRYRKFS